MSKKNKRETVTVEGLRSSQPRLIKYPKFTTLQKLKEEIKTQFKDVFTNDGNSDELISIEIRDNLPTVNVGKYGARRSAACDFCKE